jgi:hypothetical protein
LLTLILCFQVLGTSAVGIVAWVVCRH